MPHVGMLYNQLAQGLSVMIASKSHNRYYRRFGLLVVLTLCFALYFLIDIYNANGLYYCSWLDINFHITPCRGTIQTHEFIRKVEFSSDSKLILITGVNSVSVWDVSTLNLITTVEYGKEDDLDRLHWGTFSFDSNLIAISGTFGVKVIEWKSNQMKFIIPADRSLKDLQSTGVTFSPNGKFLAVSERYINKFQYPQGRVRLFDAHSGELLETIPGNYMLNRSDLRFTPDSSHLLFWVASQLWIWDIQEKRITSMIHGYPEVSDDTNRLIAYETNGMSVMSMNVNYDSYDLLYTVKNNCTYEKKVDFLPQQDWVLAITNTPDDLFFPSISPTMCLWQMNDGQVRWQSTAQGSCIDIAPSGEFVVICRGGVQIWRISPTWP
jgi:WD40 repeat protein